MEIEIFKYREHTIIVLTLPKFEDFGHSMRWNRVNLLMSYLNIGHLISTKVLLVCECILGIYMQE